MHPVPDRVKPSFVIRALWRSDSCTRMATVGFKGLMLPFCGTSWVQLQSYQYRCYRSCPVGHGRVAFAVSDQWSLLERFHASVGVPASDLRTSRLSFCHAIDSFPQFSLRSFCCYTHQKAPAKRNDAVNVGYLRTSVSRRDKPLSLAVAVFIYLFIYYTNSTRSIK